MPTLPGAQSLNEWSSRVNGFIHGCAEAGALVISHISNGQPLSTSELTSVIQQAVAAGQTVDTGGSQTTQQASWDLTQLGVPNTVSYPTSANLGAFLNGALAVGRPIELGVYHGGALTGDNPGLGGHFVDVVGQNANGSYQVADPNTSASQSGGLVSDTLAQLQAAGVFGAVTPNAAAGDGSGIQTLSSTSSGISNPLDPQSWISAIESAATAPLQRYGLVVFGGLLLLIGVLILFFAQPSTQALAGQAASLAEVAA